MKVIGGLLFLFFSATIFMWANFMGQDDSRMEITEIITENVATGEVRYADDEEDYMQEGNEMLMDDEMKNEYEMIEAGERIRKETIR